MNLTIGQFIAALGIPSALTGLAVWYLKRYLDRRDRKNEEKEKAHTELECAVIESVNASLALGQATATAVARIPDAHCNGDMHAAMAYADEVKRRQKQLLMRMGISAVFETD